MILKACVAGFVIGIILGLVASGLWPALLLLLLIPFFMDFSGDGDGRQWPDR